MRKQEFMDLIYYLRNRPEAREQLREVLGMAEQEAAAEEAARWVTARQAGELIGKSCRWVRANITLFVTAKRVARGKTFGWVMQAGDVRSSYGVWMTNRAAEQRGPLKTARENRTAN